MCVFATPDFGVTGIIALFWLIVGAVVLLLAGVGIFFGARLWNSNSSARRKFGVLLFLASWLFPLFCYFTPTVIFRIEYGNYPIGSYPSGKIRNGMSVNDVEAFLGAPHKRSKEDDRETWLYWIDSFGMYWVGVDFGPDGRVTNMYGN